VGPPEEPERLPEGLAQAPEEPVQTPPEEPWAPIQPPERELTPVSDTELRRKLKEPDFTGGNQFWPSVIFGAREKAGLRLVNGEALEVV
jgi:hypothetical protein